MPEKPKHQPKSGVTKRLELEYERAIRKIVAKVMPPRGSTPDLQKWIDQIFEKTQSPEIHALTNRLAEKMVRWVNIEDARTWREAAARSQRGRMLYRLLQKEMEGPVGRKVGELIAENAVLIRSIPLDAATITTREIMRLQQKGARPETIAKALRVKLPQHTAARVRLIARTESMKASAALTQARATHLGVKAYVWRTSEDQRVRKSHRNLDGVIILYAKPPQPEKLVRERSTLGVGQAGEFPNCFPGDERLSYARGLKKLWRAPYTGDVVNVTVGSAQFAVTPNHPILTLRGWIAARNLQKGDYVVQTRRNGFDSPEVNVSHSVSRFQDVFGTASSHMGSTTSFAFDFHGDVINDEVDVVSADYDLPPDYEPSFLQRLGQLGLSFPNGRIFSASICGIFAHIADSLESSWGDLQSSLFRSQLLHFDAIGIALGAPLYSPLLEYSSDYISGNSINICDSDFAHFPEIEIANVVERQINATGGIFPMARNVEATTAESLAESVRIDPEFRSGILQGTSALYQATPFVDKSVRKFNGLHVFTAETKDGWYGVTSTGIISKNCRCVQLPLLSADDVRWPHRVFDGRTIRYMTKAEFLKLEA